MADEKKPWLLKLGTTVLARCKDREDARAEMTDYKKERDGLVQYNLRLGRHLAVINEDFEARVHESLNHATTHGYQIIETWTDEEITQDIMMYDVQFEGDIVEDVIACVRTWKILRKEARRAEQKPE